MSDDRRVDELLAPLRDGPDPESPPAIDRDRVLARMAAAAKAAPVERPHRTRRLAILAAAAAFAVLLGAAGAKKFVRDRAGTLDVVAVAGNVSIEKVSSEELAPGRAVRLPTEGTLATAPLAEAHVRTGAGIELDVLESTRLPLADLESRSGALHLGAGGVRCHVPRLPSGQTFSVVTPDATVVVHGTVFSVDVRPDAARAATYTTVRVDEGEVVVRHASGEATLTAAQSWTNRPAQSPATLAPPPSGPAPPPAAEAPAKAAPGGGARKANDGAASPGTLDEETRLLRSGLAAERSGDLADAAASFEQLLSRYPQSPLVPDARAALARVRARRRTHGP